MLRAQKDTGRIIFDSAGEGAAISVPMRRQIHPRHLTCPMHLRRICGVCAFFDGESMRSHGDCQKHEFRVSGRASAADCDDWGRKHVEVNQ
jgi:hypothetical protein